MQYVTTLQLSQVIGETPSINSDWVLADRQTQLKIIEAWVLGRETLLIFGFPNISYSFFWFGFPEYFFWYRCSIITWICLKRKKKVYRLLYVFLPEAEIYIAAFQISIYTLKAEFLLREPYTALCLSPHVLDALRLVVGIFVAKIRERIREDVRWIFLFCCEKIPIKKAPYFINMFFSNK